MRLAFRVDASRSIGTGHVARCLALADYMRELGAVSHFICRDHVGNLRDFIVGKGHEVSMLSLQHVTKSRAAPFDYAEWVGAALGEDALQTKSILAGYSPDWIIVDHYGLDVGWEEIVHAHGRLMVIDDLAIRRHECDLLLDQNPGRTAADYEDLVPSETPRLIGPAYALLRREFRESRTRSLNRRRARSFRRILVSFGGVDQDNVSELTLQSLAYCNLPVDIEVVVALGEAAPWQESVKRFAASAPYHCEVVIGSNNLAELMATSDISIGAGGGMAVERCCMGLPSVLVVLADNQLRGANALASLGAALGPIFPGQIPTELCPLVLQLQAPDLLEACSLQASNLTNGEGCSLVAENLLGQLAADA